MFLFDAILLPKKSTQSFLLIPLCLVRSAHEQLSRAITFLIYNIFPFLENNSMMFPSFSLGKELNK